MDEVPFEDRHVPRTEIDWDRSAWWWHPLSRAIHPAIKMTTLVVSLLAVWLAKAGVVLAVRLFDPAWESPVEVAPESASGFFSPLAVWLGTLFQSMVSLPFGVRELAFATFVAVWLTAVFSMLGGVLARRAMVELGQQSVAPWGESIQIVFKRWVSYVWATGMHLVGIFALLLPFVLLGLISRFGSVAANICGVLLLVGFPLAFAVGRLTMSMVFCYPLSVCAIGAEKKADAFEGFSRSNAYLYQRPVVALLCACILAAVGFFGEQLVLWTLTFGWGLIRGAYYFGGAELQEASTKYVWTGDWLKFELIAAYWFSYFWSASAAVYLILRKSVDNTELHELDAIVSSVEKTLPEIPATAPASSEPAPEGEVAAGADKNVPSQDTSSENDGTAAKQDGEDEANNA